MISFRTLRSGFRGLESIRRVSESRRNLSQLIPRDLDQEQFVQQIRSATSASDIFHLVKQRDKLPLPQIIIIQSMKSLFELQKAGMLNASDVVSHPGFEGLCKQLKIKCINMEYNTIVDVLKILTYMGVPPNAEIYHIFLSLARDEINSASLMQIVFLDFVLQKVDARKNALVDALRIAFTIVFQMNISAQIDHNSVPQLLDYLGFISRNKVNRKTGVCVINALILHEESFSSDDARKIAWSLCDDVNPCSEQREKLFSNVLNCLSKKVAELSVEMLESTVSKMAKKFAVHPNMYHERFLNETANSLIDRNVDFTQISYFLKGFNRMSFVHLKLLNHLLVLIRKDPTLLKSCRPTSVLSVIGAFSNANLRYFVANYKDVIISSLFANPLFSRDLIQFPWTKLACDLAALDIYEPTLYGRILSSRFLKDYLARESTIDYLQLLKLYQSVTLLEGKDVNENDLKPYLLKARNIVISKQDFPLKRSLEYAFGGQEYVGTKVVSKYFHLIDHVLQFNANKDICKLTELPSEDGTISLEGLSSSSTEITTVAVMGLPVSYLTSNLGTIKGAFELQFCTLGKLGVKVVPVELELWSSLPDREKIPFLQREIKSKL